MKKYSVNKLSPTKRLPPESTCLFPDHANRYEGDYYEPNVLLYLGAVGYRLLDELPEQAVVTGNLRCNGSSKHPDSVVCQGVEQYPCYDKQRGRLVGYLLLKDESYLAVTVERPFLLWLPPVIALLFCCTLIMVGTQMVGVPTVIYSDDPVTNGAITPANRQPLEADYFNIKINATLILADGQMNLRVENSERNIYSCYVEVTVETDAGEVNLYTSPRIEPNQHLEQATVDTQLARGTYQGTATFRYYNGNELLNTVSSVQLLISVR